MTCKGTKNVYKWKKSDEDIEKDKKKTGDVKEMIERTRRRKEMTKKKTGDGKEMIERIRRK